MGMDARTQRIFERACELVSDEARAKAAQAHNEWLELQRLNGRANNDLGLMYKTKYDALVEPQPRAERLDVGPEIAPAD